MQQRRLLKPVEMKLTDDWTVKSVKCEDGLLQSFCGPHRGDFILLLNGEDCDGDWIDANFDLIELISSK